MNFSSDRDLLALEPCVFQDVPLAAQQRLSVADGIVAGTTLSSAAADFVSAGVGAGSVVLVDGTPCEVVSRSDSHTLVVSRPRANLAEAPIPPSPGEALPLIVRTFAPQAALVHDMLLRLLELDDGAEGDEVIVTISVMVRLEALGALERIYTAAVSIIGDNETLWLKAHHYREQFNYACRRATVLMDLDGDGMAETRRCPGVVRLDRV